MAIEGEKQLAITGGESMAGSGDVKDQKKSDTGKNFDFFIFLRKSSNIGILGAPK